MERGDERGCRVLAHAGEPRHEEGAVPEDVRVDDVEQTPDFFNVVLDRRPGEEEEESGHDLLEQLREYALGGLDSMTLVQDEELDAAALRIEISQKTILSRGWFRTT